MYKVIVCMTTYNLEKYVRQALDSVLAQKTNFDFKIIVADDCSSDDTVSILQEYKEKYPEQVEVLTSDVNLGSLANSNRIFSNLQCEYFSFLDGDDYWTDIYRLQKQVDYLDKNLEYCIHAGNTQFLRDDILQDFVVSSKFLECTYSFEDYVNDKVPFVHTSSMLVRNKIFINGLPKCYRDVVDTFENCALRGEDFRRILHLQEGKMYISKDVYSIYRIHEKGMWQGSSYAKRYIEAAISENYYAKFFGESYDKYFEKRAKLTYKNLMRYLVGESDILGYYNLNQKETDLLSAYLQDVSQGQYFVGTSKSRMRKYIRKILLKIIVRL